MNEPVSLIEKYSCSAIVGGRGSGKTTYMLGDVEKNITGVCEKYLREYKMKVIFIDTIRDRPEPPDYKRIKVFSEWKKMHLIQEGAARIIVSASESDEMFEHIVEKEIKNTLFVVEDSAKLVPQDLQKHPVRTLCIDSKNLHNSFAFMYHMWTDLPPRLLGLLDQYVIFKTSADAPADRGIKNREVLEAYERVKRHSTKWHHEVVKQGA